MSSVSRAMDLKHMRAFVAVAERLSFCMAAEQLHITQPALSVQIRDLEEVIGATLLQRGKGQRVSLTQSGKVFLEGALATLRSADMAVKVVRQRSSADVGSLSIGFTDDFFNHTPLLDVLARFQADYPHVIVNHCTDLSYNLVRLLQAQQLDLAMLCFPSPMPGPEFRVIELPPMPVVVAVPRKHRLARNRSVWLRDLKGERFVMVPTHLVSGFSAHVARLFAHAGFSPNVAGYANTTELHMELVARGIGVALVTRGSLPKTAPDVALLTLRDSHPTIDTGLLRPVRGSSRFAEELSNRLVAAFKNAGATDPP